MIRYSNLVVRLSYLAPAYRVQDVVVLRDREVSSILPNLIAKVRANEIAHASRKIRTRE